MLENNRIFYTVISIIVVCTTVLVWRGSEPTSAAQNTSCIGAVEFIANHDLAEQAVDTLIQQHQEIYTKDPSLLTPEDYAIVASDVAFYATQLALIEAPEYVKSTLTTEIAMYFTLSAMLYSGVNVTSPTADLSGLYNQAGTALSMALQNNATALITTCDAYDEVYGNFSDTSTTG